MTLLTEQTKTGIEELLACCDHILEEKMTEQELQNIRIELNELCQQAENYRSRLQDQKQHSRSDLSRKIASQLLQEDRKLSALLSGYFPERENGAWEEERDADIGALYVEYLTGRARQSIREALIGAIHLKILQKETEQNP